MRPDRLAVASSALAILVIGGLAGCGSTEIGTTTSAAAPAVSASGERPWEAPPCNLFAAPDGRDDAGGSLDAPLRSPQALVDSLSPGEAGCFLEGKYRFEELRVATPGIVLQSRPGEAADLRGRIYVTDEADGGVISGLALDGRNPKRLPSPTINADGFLLRGSDITNFNTAICINVGSLDPELGSSVGAVIEENVIHRCGHLPATNFDHGIYLTSSDGAIVRNNVIRDNADRGIQLYPDAQNTRIVGNLIEGNGEGILFGGDETHASSGNLVEDNVIIDSKLRFNVESSWTGPVGSGNVVRGNCIGGGARDGGHGERGIGPQEGFTVVESGEGASPPCDRRGLALDPSG